MDKLTNQIKKELTEGEFIASAYPAMNDWGLEDQDVMIHSLGVSCWNTLGHKLEFMAVAECPAPFSKLPGDDIRSDSAWFDMEQRKPVSLVEFERYDGTNKGKLKLKDKIENLFEACERWNRFPELLILAYWTCNVVSVPDHKALIGNTRKGFKNKKGALISANFDVEFLITRFCFQYLKTNKLILDRIIFEA